MYIDQIFLFLSSQRNTVAMCTTTQGYGLDSQFKNRGGGNKIYEQMEVGACFYRRRFSVCGYV